MKKFLIILIIGIITITIFKLISDTFLSGLICGIIYKAIGELLDE